MNKHWIEAFISVCQTDTVSQAARNLFLTQPSVSSRIQLLEQELGEPLFFRSGRRMILTEAGKTFLPYAKHLVDTWEKGQSAIQKQQHTMSGSVTVALFYSSISTFSSCLTAFTQKYPEVRLKIQSRHSEEIGELLLNHEAQIGIARSLHLPSLQSYTLITDNYVLATSPRYQEMLTRHSMRELHDGPFIVNYSSQFDREAFHHFLKKRNYATNVLVETDNLEICKQYVLDHSGVAFMPRFYIDADLKSGSIVEIETIPNDIIPSRSIDLIWLKHHENSKVVSALLEHIQKYMNIKKV